MKTIINLFFLIVLLHIFLSGCSKTNEDELDTSIVTEDNTDITAPVIAEGTAVTTPTTDSTPSYTFSSFPDGKKYVGEYKDDKRWNGTEYDKDGNIIYRWVNGKRIKQ